MVWIHAYYTTWHLMFREFSSFIPFVLVFSVVLLFYYIIPRIVHIYTIHGLLNLISIRKKNFIKAHEWYDHNIRTNIRYERYELLLYDIVSFRNGKNHEPKNRQQKWFDFENVCLTRGVSYYLSLCTAYVRLD